MGICMNGFFFWISFFVFFISCSFILSPLLKCCLAFFFSDLNKHKRYEILLSVYNAVGEGPSSAPQEVFVGEAGRVNFTVWSIFLPSIIIHQLFNKQNTFLLNVCSSFSSPNCSTSKCSGTVFNSYSAGCYLGPTSSGCSERRHTGLQGVNIVYTLTFSSMIWFEL